MAIHEFQIFVPPRERLAGKGVDGVEMEGFHASQGEKRAFSAKKAVFPSKMAFLQRLEMNPFPLEMNLPWLEMGKMPLEMHPFSQEMNLQPLEMAGMPREMHPFPQEMPLQWLEIHPLPSGIRPGTP